MDSTNATKHKSDHWFISLHFKNFTKMALQTIKKIKLGQDDLFLKHDHC